MRYTQIRNATCVLELGGARVLVDPMLGDPGTLPPYAVLRSRVRRNPLTPLPEGTSGMLKGIDACVITHTHFGVDCDHLDKPGAALLRDRSIPVFCRSGDERRLRKRGIEPTPVNGEKRSFLGGTIGAVPAAHGRGIVGKLMGPGVGYLIEIPGEPLVYITGDTVLTDGVRRTLETRRPEICIVPGGGARLDVGGPVLMSIDELTEFVRLAPGTVIINHVGALNHCPTTHEDIRTALGPELLERVLLPIDGESLAVAGPPKHEQRNEAIASRGVSPPSVDRPGPPRFTGA